MKKADVFAACRGINNGVCDCEQRDNGRYCDSIANMIIKADGNVHKAAVTEQDRVANEVEKAKPARTKYGCSYGNGPPGKGPCASDMFG